MSKEEYLFEVLRNKEGIMATNSVVCIYDKSVLDDMSKNGYKFKLNGKAATVAQIIQYVKSHK